VFGQVGGAISQVTLMSGKRLACTSRSVGDADQGDSVRHPQSGELLRAAQHICHAGATTGASSARVKAFGCTWAIPGIAPDTGQQLSEID